MRELTIVTTCDFCLELTTPKRVFAEGDPVPIKIGEKTGQLDPCGEHREMLEFILAVLNARGVPIGSHLDHSPNPLPPAPPEAPQPAQSPVRSHVTGLEYPCPKCGKVFERDDVVYRHIESQHGITRAQINGEKCPACGKSSPSMGRHVVQAHGTSMLSLVTAMHSADDDPHGQIARIYELFR